MTTSRLTRREAIGSLATLAGSALVSQAVMADDPARPIRIGIIGLDTSHVITFTKLINRDDPDDRLKQVKIAAAFPAGNPDFPLSRDRVKGYTAEMGKMGVDIVESIEALLEKVDVVMLESVDGSQHLEQVKPVFKARKPTFIDKPIAASLADVVAIDKLAREHKVAWFSASSSRFTEGYPELRNNTQIGNILGCDTYSQSRAAPHHPDLYWYGVHGVDLLYSILGCGCLSVTAVQTKYTEQVTGTWSDGRVGTFRAIREHTGQTGLGASVFGTKRIVQINNYYNYVPLVVEVAKFFTTGKSPIVPEEMVEVFAFMEAAEESKRQGGAPVLLKDVLSKAGAVEKKQE